QRGKNILGEKFFAEVLDDDLARAGVVGLLDHSFEIIALSDVADHGNDVVRIVFLQPRNDDRRVETTGISEYDFFRHGRSSPGSGSFRHPAAKQEWLSGRACGSRPGRRQWTARNQSPHR